MLLYFKFIFNFNDTPVSNTRTLPVNIYFNDTLVNSTRTLPVNIYFNDTLVSTLGTRGFSRVQREFSVLAEGRHVFGRRPKPRAAKPREKPLARSSAFYRPR